MPIVCPHCATSYAVDSAKLGPDGRSVRCARCKEVWLARPDDAVVETARALVPAMASGTQSFSIDDDAAWGIDPAQDDVANPPHIDSPSIAGEMPADEPGWAAAARQGEVIDAKADETPIRKPANRRARRPGRRVKDVKTASTLGALFSLRNACLAMTALIAALFIWRADMVRLLPQTATFFKALGVEVNLRGLAFKDVKLSNEMVDGKSVLVIEGNIVTVSRKPAELPRMRFVVRDGKGTEIYAWNAALEKEGLNPGDMTWFKSRLAAPPPEGATIDIRFLNKRDIAAGAA